MIESREVFHVNRPVPWAKLSMLKLGDTFELNAAPNPYFRQFDKPPLVKTRGVSKDKPEYVPTVTYITESLQSDVENPQILPLSIGISAHFIRLSRELLWESIREKYYPALPSRQRCIWVENSHQDANDWVSQQKLIDNYQIVRLLAQGVHHRADQNHLMNGSEGLGQALRNAHDYWKGEVTPHPSIERLFIGRAKVLEIVDTKIKNWSST